MNQSNDPSLALDDNLPVVDVDQVSFLVPTSADEDNMLADLLGIFASESEPRLKQIRLSCETRDNEALKKLVHFIAGSSANLGALRLSTLCRQVEASLNEGVFSGYAELPQALEHAYQEGLDALRREALLN